jgi:hypothetical protein
MTSLDPGERLLEQNTAIHFSSYRDLLRLVQTFQLPSDDDVEGGAALPNRRLLPVEVCVQVLQWLVVERIQMSHVSAIGCSSIATTRWNGYQPSLPDCLAEDETSWWISKERLRDRPQYVDFCCVPPGRSHSVRRIQKVSIQIPPFPSGPYSLCDFVVQAAEFRAYEEEEEDIRRRNDEWKTISPEWKLEYIPGWQSFEWPYPVDVRYLRLLCRSNQCSEISGHPAQHDVVGFYSIRFE